MSKRTHFSGQLLYCQIIKLLDKSKVLNKSREKGGERYVKSFDGWAHLVVMTSRSTLSDANKRRPEFAFESIYRDLYATYRNQLSSNSRSHKEPKWMTRLQIIDSTTISLFSNLLFKGVGRNTKTGKKKGGIEGHTVIHAKELSINKSFNFSRLFLR